MTEMLDQTDLTERAERLVAAARKAGADAADAVCVRGISLSVDVRLGKVEETRRAEGDDFTLRAFVGRRSATVSANVLTDPAELAERAVAMAKVAPEDRFAGLRRAKDRWPRASPISTCSIADMPSADELTQAALAVEDAARAVPASPIPVAPAPIGGWAAWCWPPPADSPAPISARVSVSVPRRSPVSGTAMERDYDGESKVYRADLCDPEVIGRNAGERAVHRLNPRQMATGRVTVVYDPRVAVGLVGHLAGAINGAPLPARPASCATSSVSSSFRRRFSITDDPLRPRGLGSRPFDGEGVAGVRHWMSSPTAC